MFKFCCRLLLESIDDQTPAKNVTVDLDGDIYYQADVLGPVEIFIDRSLNQGSHELTVHFYGKTDLDQHQALRVSDLEIFGLSDKKFIWEAEYNPCYPEPWYTQQIQQGLMLPRSIKQVDYLGWNGTWNLKFELPVFTWIHRVQNLGWIYD